MWTSSSNNDVTNAVQKKAVGKRGTYIYTFQYLHFSYTYKIHVDIPRNCLCQKAISIDYSSADYLSAFFLITVS